MYPEPEFWIALSGATLLFVVLLVSGVRIVFAHGTIKETAVGLALTAFSTGLLAFLAWEAYNVITV